MCVESDSSSSNRHVVLEFTQVPAMTGSEVMTFIEDRCSLKQTAVLDIPRRLNTISFAGSKENCSEIGGYYLQLRTRGPPIGSFEVRILFYLTLHCSNDGEPREVAS